MTHPHRDLIIALLDDPTLKVEVFVDDGHVGKWLSYGVDNSICAIVYMTQHPERQFRLREKPKPDVVITYPVHMKGLSVKFYPKDGVGDDNLRLTFSADGVLKNAEVI